MNNPFSHTNEDKSEIWNMLVEKDIVAFVNQDWDSVENDFLKDEFAGINANRNGNPDNESMTDF